MHNDRRAPTYRRNPDLEALLAELSALLEPVEQGIMARYERPRYPVLFVVGVPRSGSTLLMQWLAQTGYFAYPTNLLSRFYAAPYIGARIQQLLTDPRYSFNDELRDLASMPDLISDLGKTRGALSPNEFWYFWRRFIPNAQPRRLTPEEEQQVDGKGLSAELAALEAVFNQPLALKALILQLNLPWLAGFFNQPLFLHITRHPFYTLQSLLLARERYFGDRAGWYSIQPPEYAWLQARDPVEQVAGQVYFTQRGVEAGLAQLPPANVLTIGYERFCAAPGEIFGRIQSHLAALGYPSQGWTYHGPERLTDTNQVRLTPDDAARAQRAYAQFSGEPLSL